MAPVNLAAMDLNLLVVLDALLTEHSVSRAAKRIHSTQPAVSRALGRLRAWFDDPLLTRSRHGMVPTATALALAGEVHAVLEQIQGVIGRREVFVPASSQRVFRLSMTEFEQYVVCAPLLGRLAEAAPGVTVNVLPWSLGFPDALGSGALDLAITPPTSRIAGFHSFELFTDEQVVVVRRGHPTIKDRMTLRQLAALTHLQSAPNGREGSLIDDLLEAAGLSRRVIMRVSSTLMLPALVATSDCCAIIPSRLAADAADRWSLAVLPLPLKAPGIALHVVWHERADHDPGTAWLRAQLESIRDAIARPGPRSAAGTLDLSRRARHTL